ncbi:MAG: hypothetical protein LUH07_01705 [Lachnospiraceae bacterium]|nr:hypothetical protein [Lachnospiraceae bacterium]
MRRKRLFLLCMMTLSLSMIVQASEESKSAVVPLPTGIDTEAIEDGGSAVFAAEFSIDDFYMKETSELAVRMDVCDRELFDLLDISLLEEGDTIVLGGEDVTVETLERGEDGSVIINGGSSLDGGHILLTDEDTVYYEADVDGAPYYLKVGELDIELDGDFIFTDCSGDEMVVREYTWEDMLAYEQAGIQNLSFTAEDTVVTVENGFVMNIARTCSEAETDMETESSTPRTRSKYSAMTFRYLKAPAMTTVVPLRSGTVVSIQSFRKKKMRKEICGGN